MSKILGTILYPLLAVQEVVLHSMGFPHLEANQFDPMLIKHTCDSCCEWFKALVRA